MSTDPFSQEKPVRRMKKDLDLEKYMEKTVNIGLYSEEDVNINMSPEGKKRRNLIDEVKIKSYDQQKFAMNA